jgi:hypothetical protein
MMLIVKTLGHRPRPRPKHAAKEALDQALVFENSDASGAVIEHVLPGIVVGFMGLPPGALRFESRR